MFYEDGHKKQVNDLSLQFGVCVGTLITPDNKNHSHVRDLSK